MTMCINYNNMDILHTEGDRMIGFILGSLLGGMVGMFAACLCVATGRADRWMNCTSSEKDF